MQAGLGTHSYQEKSLIYLHLQTHNHDYNVFLTSAVHGKVVSKFESETLCKAYVYLYLGDDPLDKEAKEKFGMSLISLF